MVGSETGRDKVREGQQAPPLIQRISTDKNFSVLSTGHWTLGN